MTKTRKPSAAVDLLIPSALIIKNNVFVFFVLLVIPMLLGYISNPMPELSENATISELLSAYMETITPYMTVGTVLTLIFFPLLTFAQWQAAKTGETSFKNIFIKIPKYYWRLLGLLLAMGALIAVGLVAFIVPGIIALRCLLLSPYYMLEKNLGIKESIKQSYKKSKDFKWSIYGILGIMFLFAITAGFGILAQICSAILITLYNAAPALRFFEIKDLKKPQS